ncbi:hypothetical protein WN48_07457 [Eufriesea mexicana]|uniref:Uncharacterized protein n=1 Tax=Eufriesea mexicana TaxID=516756 RepID=A0A310SR96_9HYME|nr:hypothetical protein WN48_07457 [Eufriesea mexicana]
MDRSTFSNSVLKVTTEETLRGFRRESLVVRTDTERVVHTFTIFRATPFLCPETFASPYSNTLHDTCMNLLLVLLRKTKNPVAVASAGNGRQGNILFEFLEHSTLIICDTVFRQRIVKEICIVGINDRDNSARVPRG